MSELQISNRTIIRVLAWIGVFILLGLALVRLQRELIWVGVSIFLALALESPVNYISKYLPRRSRGLAVLFVFLVALLILGFVGFVLTPPIVRQSNDLVHAIPRYYNEFLQTNNIAANYLRSHDIQSLASNYQDKIISSVASRSAFGIFGSIIGSIIGFITILTLTFFTVLELPRLEEIFWRYQPNDQRERRQHLWSRMRKTVSGYVNGNLLTSVIAAVSTMIMLLILGVPYRVSLGVLVGILDLIPLVGATLAAVIVAIMVLIFGGVTKAIIVIIFFVIYQQVENHILQPMVYSKTVRISPLIVAIAAIFGAVLGGIVGVLVAIPIAASAQILFKDYLDRRMNTKKASS